MVIRHVVDPMVHVRWSVEGAAGRPSHPLMQDAVASAVGCPPEAVRVEQLCSTCGGPHGRPLVTVEGRPGPHVSVARADALLVVAVASAPVGIDVEAEGAGATLRAEVVLSIDELARPGAKDDLLRSWVHKEAVLKATGHGLRVEPSSLTIAPNGGRLSGWAGPGRRPAMRLGAVDLGPGYVAAVARAGRRRPRLEVRQTGAQPAAAKRRRAR